MSARPDQVTVLLTGASSQIGVFLIPRLLGNGFRVISFSRQAPLDPPDLGENPFWMHPDTLTRGSDENEPPGVIQADSLISCGPLPLANQIVRLCSGIRRAIVFSTSSVFSKVRSPEPDESEQIAGILACEAELKALCADRELALLILRPTLIYGCGLDRNVSLLAAWIRRHGWLPLAGAASGLRQPVHADDLAEVAVMALQREHPLQLDSPACGASTLTYHHMVELVFDSLGKRRRILRVPAGLLTLPVRLFAWLPSFQGMNPQMISRQKIDLVFDDSPLKQALDYKPRSFKPTSADFEIPSSANKYQLTKRSDRSSA